MWIKICGTTSREDAELAIESGADALGFVFAPSPRRVTPAHVAGILSDLSITIETFGVFVDSSLDEIIATVLRCGLSGVQLHGSSDATLPRRLRRHFLRVSPARKLSIMCAVHYGNALHQQLLSFRDDAHVDAIVVDSRTATAVGGTGTTYDWAAARESFFASAPHLRLVAAGGLSPENVKQAIIALQPWGVDVVSGVEAAPGRKDPERVRAFIRNARAAASQMQPTPEPART